MRERMTPPEAESKQKSQCISTGFFINSMAVTVGFEPTVGFHPHNFSRVAPSAARTRHRQVDYYIGGMHEHREFF
ncbi:MAG: hypothetical protein RL196_1281 [Actinomycetota bacterium]